MAAQPPRRLPQRWLRYLLAALAALPLCLSSSSGEASEPPRVVMVTRGESSVISERVRAELAAMGFSIVLDRADAELTREQLASVARERAAGAAVLLSASTLGIELWVVDSAHEETRLRSFIDPAPPGAAPTLTLRAAELLRASLLEIAMAQEPAGVPDAAPSEPQAQGQPQRKGQSERQAPEEAELPVRAPSPISALHPAPTTAAHGASRAVSLSLGAGLVTSAGGLSAFPGAQLAGKLWLTQHLGAELSVLLPLIWMSERSSEGSSRTRAAALSLAVAYEVPLGSSPWSWDMGAGVAAVALQTRGTPASAAYTRKENVAFALAPLLRTALFHSLGQRWRLGLDSSIGVTLPRFLIVYAGRTAATWGLPFVSGQLALEVALP